VENVRSSPLVLVVEDYDDTRELYSVILGEAGFRVATARNGEEAVATAKASKPDAIVMDLQMPVMDGWDAIRAIRKLDADPRPYILALTAHVAEASRVACYDAGCDDMIAKPVASDELVAIVRAALRMRVVTLKPPTQR
jgi:DNA-binding response OmpR family regulator